MCEMNNTKVRLSVIDS